MSEGNFECRVSAKRETSAGIFLTLQLQPDDYTAPLATLRVGSALMLGWAEVVDTSVQPISLPHGSPVNGNNGQAKLENEPGNRGIAEPSTTKEARPFTSLPLSQQAALLCEDARFREWLALTYQDIAADGVDSAAVVLRRALGITSRSELAHNIDAAKLWQQMYIAYQSFLTDRKYGEAARR